MIVLSCQDFRACLSVRVTDCPAVGLGKEILKIIAFESESLYFLFSQFIRRVSYLVLLEQDTTLLMSFYFTLSIMLLLLLSLFFFCYFFRFAVIFLCMCG